MSKDPNFTDQMINLNIRISKNLKEGSASILQGMGINQSQYVRDALQYVINHNLLPWQVKNANSVFNKYLTIRNDVNVAIVDASSGSILDSQQVLKICAKLDDIQLYGISILDGYFAQGVTSIPLCKLNSLLTQLASLFRHNGIDVGHGWRYEKVATKRMTDLFDLINETIGENNL